MQMAQLINQYDEARSAVATVGNLVNQPAEEGVPGTAFAHRSRAKWSFPAYLQI
jgi:hypothetical protein